MISKEYSLQATTKKFEGKFAMLETEDRQNLLWPIKDLPDDVQEGMKVRLLISTEKSDKEARDKTAKAMLNHLLGN